MTTTTQKTAPKSAKKAKNTALSTEQTQSNPSATTATTVHQAPPPADAHIPAPPIGYTPSGNSIFLGVLPRLIELGALPGAVEDLRSFGDYDAVLGNTAPPLAELTAAFDIADQWSTMRKASQIWDAFAQMQEGIAWATVRPLMDRLRTAFLLAAAHNPSLQTRFANLTTLLTAKQSIARKGVATKALNKQAAAEGKPQIHGKAGKRRKKAADKAIVAAVAEAGATPATPPVTTPPVATPPVATPPPATAPAATPAGNGAAHS